NGPGLQRVGAHLDDHRDLLVLDGRRDARPPQMRVKLTFGGRSSAATRYRWLLRCHRLGGRHPCRRDFAFSQYLANDAQVEFVNGSTSPLRPLDLAAPADA